MEMEKISFVGKSAVAGAGVALALAGLFSFFMPASLFMIEAIALAGSLTGAGLASYSVFH